MKLSSLIIKAKVAPSPTPNGHLSSPNAQIISFLLNFTLLSLPLYCCMSLSLILSFFPHLLYQTLSLLRKRYNHIPSNILFLCLLSYKLFFLPLSISCITIAKQQSNLLPTWPIDHCISSQESNTNSLPQLLAYCCEYDWQSSINFVSEIYAFSLLSLHLFFYFFTSFAFSIFLIFLLKS